MAKLPGPMIPIPPPLPCQHSFIYLRQEDEREGGYRPNIKHFDVYFCSHCLTYKKVLVAESYPEGGGSGYVRRSVL
jgi:hypothetical protein